MFMLKLVRDHQRLGFNPTRLDNHPLDGVDGAHCSGPCKDGARFGFHRSAGSRGTLSKPSVKVILESECKYLRHRYPFRDRSYHYYRFLSLVWASTRLSFNTSPVASRSGRPTASATPAAGCAKVGR